MRIHDILDISDNLLKLILKLILKDSLQPASVKMFENLPILISKTTLGASVKYFELL